MSNAAPGWYPDSTGAQRWWDGTQWTQAAPAAYTASFLPERAPDGTSPHTVQIWAIIAVFFVESLASTIWLGTFDWSGYMTAMLPSSGSYGPGSSLAMFGYLYTPGYFAVIALSWLGYGGSVVLAYFDARELRRRGVQRPFHWAFSFIFSIVYVIGRSVVVKRRTGTGLSPMAVMLALYGLSIVLSLIATFVSMASMMDAVTGLYQTYP